ncbi:MAG: DEAD/DEAH box helicase [Fenollaria massiliensis]
MNNFITELSEKAFNDEYLISLIYNLEKNYCNKLLDKEFIIKLTEEELYDLMRFSDILCRSSKDEHKNLSLKIVSLIYEFKELLEDEFIKLSIINVLTKLGNFPSLNLIRMKNENTGVDEIDLDLIIKSVYNMSPIGKIFTDEQLKVFNELKTNNHFSVSGSTSFGKSFIFEAFTKYLIEEHNKSDNIAFIVPTKALINQVSNKIRHLVKEDGYKVISSPEIPKVLQDLDKKYIFVFTPERLISYLSKLSNPKIDYLFVDEAHKLLNDKDTRTPLMYHALVLARRKSVNIFFAAPNIPNPSVFLELVNNTTEESYEVKTESVAQNRFVINCYNDCAYMISDFGEDIYLPKLKFSDNVINNLSVVLNTFSNDRQSIVYCNSKYKTIITATQYANILDEVDDDDVNDLIKMIEEKVHEQYYLRFCLKRGVAYHFGGIPEEIKARVEELYKKGSIRIIFCTSTLLEGVNLPAKNIFILSENIGLTKMSDVDFWNLAGRAGRLSKDLSGNIFCVNIYNQHGYWKDSESLDILRQKNIQNIKPVILRDNNKNLYKNIANYYMNKAYTNKKLSETDKKIIEMYGNILLYHDTVNSDSILKDKFIDTSKNSLEVLKKIRTNNSVPSDILAESINIKISAQNSVFNGPKNPLPTDTSYEGCYEVLKILCDQYDWLTNESKGNNPMIKSYEQLSYYAILLEGWINDKQLNYLIKKTIDYYYNNGDSKYIYLNKNEGRYYDKFDKTNAYHINSLINALIIDLENNIKYKIKAYVSNYQSILISNNIDCACDWEKYIDYGTTNPKLIDIQNLGFSRNIARFLSEKFNNLFKVTEGEITGIESEQLKSSINKEIFPNEYKELSDLFDWDD